jgi:hypothetical protein
VVHVLITGLVLKLRGHDILSWSTHFFRDHILVNFLLVIITTPAGKIIWTFMFMRRTPLVAKKSIVSQVHGHQQ